MKRLMLLLAFLISIGTSAFGQLVKEVTLSSETNLAAALGEDAAKVTTLKISGPLTEADFATMKNDMAMLQVLDMSGVTSLPLISYWENGHDVFYQGIPYSALRGKLTLQKVFFPVCLQIVFSEAFRGCSNLLEIVFPESSKLKRIDGWAFAECSGLQALDLANCQYLSVIGGDAFYSCNNLKSVNLSGCSSLQRLGSCAFMSCSSLQAVDLSNCSQLNAIESSAFQSCSVLRNVTLTGCTALQTIESDAFGWCYKLSDFDFTQLTALNSIGSEAFCSTLLSGEIKFASTINQLGKGAFNDCDQVTSVNLSNSAIAVVSANTFSGCDKLQKVDFTGCSSLNTLNKDAFNNCSALQEVVIENGFYKSVDGVLYVVDMATLMLYPAGKTDAAFTIPNSVLTIQSSAFPYNKNLKKLTIPEFVKSIQPEAFLPEQWGPYPSYTIIMEAATPIGLSSNIGLNSAIIYVPGGALDAYKQTAIWKDYTLIEIGAAGTTVALETAGSLGAKLTELGVTLNTIQELTITGPMNASDFEVIKQMTLLTKVNLSGTTMEENRLPNNAFKNLFYLKEVSLPNSITVIDSEAFYYLSNLERVNLPTALERINYRAFYYCSSLQEVELSLLEHLQSIDTEVFQSCSAIPSTLKLPNSLESIGWGAFYGTNVRSVDFSNTSLRGIENDAFRNCVITSELSFPTTLMHIGDGAFNAATPSSIKLKSSWIVGVGSVFDATDKTTCKVYVPKGLGATYKADTYWSPFGDNIVEYGNLVVTSVNNNYGYVNGGGAYEKDEQVTLTAVCNEGFWDSWQKFVHLFDGWYEDENKVKNEASYTFTMGEADKAVAARFERIYFESSNSSKFPLTYKDRTAKSITVTVDLSELSNDQLYYGWYDNNDQLITKETSITVQAGSGDRIYTARIGSGSTEIYGTSTVDDASKVDGQEIVLWGNLTVVGSKEWNLKGFTYCKDASLLVESPMNVETISLNGYMDERKWYFISFPYDLKLSEITLGRDRQFAVREYDGAARAANGMGASWKQLSADATLQANKGYIMQYSSWGSGTDSYTAASGMETLFNRQAVTIPLPAHASNVPADANWNLVGNPFPCYFSVEQLFDDGLDGTVTVWSDDIQNYEYYTRDDKGVYLAPLTAFFIQHNQAASVTFNPEGRAATLPTTRAAVADLRSDAGREVINLLLANDSLSDKTRVVFNEAASTDYELGKDAAKFSSMNNNAPSLYTLDAQNQQLAINERPVGNGVVRLGCYIGVKGSYTLSAKEALASDLYLYDTETDASCNLRETSYTFTAEAGACNNRFELRTSLKGTGIAAIEGFSWQVAGNQLLLNGLPTGATVSLFDANGRMLFAGDAATATQGMALPQSGIYYLTIRTAEGVSSTVSIKR